MKNHKWIKIVICLVLSVCLLDSARINVSAERVNADYGDFIRGVDLSNLDMVEELGGVFYENGVKKDAMEILKEHGANYVRLKLWVDPYDREGNSYGGGGNDYETTLSLAQRAKRIGMKVLIDFHLSDFWADPGTQTKPKAWTDLSYSALKTTLHQYMKATMDDFVSDGVIPDMVQIGNETSSGILWDDGKVGSGNEDFTQLAELVNEAIEGVRESVGDQTQIILHLDNGGSYSLYQWWFDGITGCGIDLDFDIIGLSYYPMWHGTMDELQYNMNDIGREYNKDVLIVETAYGWTTADGDGLGSSFSGTDAQTAGYEASVQGQTDFMTDLESVILNVPNNRGLGFFYWEPAWLPVKGANWGTKAGAEYIGDSGTLSNPWDNLTLFNFNGNVLDSVDILNAPEANLVTNPGFETDGGYTNQPSGWNVWYTDSTPGYTIKTEEGYAYSGDYKLTFWNDSDYSCSVYQTITGLENGTYSLSAWIMSNGGQNTCQIYAKNYGGNEVNEKLPVSDINWNKITINDIEVTNGQCEIGLYADANGGDWCNMDHVIFRKK